jgi:hypothetical protein
MRLYIIGIMVGAIGLVAANQVRADERCGLRSDGVFKVERWKSETASDRQVRYTIDLVSKDKKAIREVSGDVEFFATTTRIAVVPLKLDREVAPKSRFTIVQTVGETPHGAIVGDNDRGIDVLACVSSITHADGSGVIIN